MSLDLQQASAIDPGGALSAGMDAAKMDDNLRAVFASEGTSSQPALPPQVQLDIAMAGGTAADVSRFVSGVNSALDKKWTELSAPDPTRIQQVAGDPSALGFMARGGQYAPSVERYNVPAPQHLSGPQGMTGEFTRAMSGVLGGGLAVKSVDALLSPFMQGGLAGGADATRWTDANPNVFDPQAVVTFQRQAVQFGLLPKTTNIDGKWKPEYSSIMYDMGQQDFSKAISGNRFGAVDPFSPSKLDLLNELMSPQFALMFVQELGSSMLYDHFWTGERINNIKADFNREWTEFREADGVWDKFTSAVGMLTAPADDIIMPVVNVGLLFLGVGEVLVAGKLTAKGGVATVKAADKAIDVAQAANKFNRANIARDLAAAQKVGRAQIFDMPGTRLIRGFDTVGRLEELQKFTREPQRLMGAWNKRGGPVGTAAYKTLNAWRQQKSAFMVKKGTQQLMRYSQERMLMGAMGDESAISARDRARDRYWGWTMENPGLAAFVGLAEGVAIPQNIYPVGTFKSQSKWAADAANALRRTNLSDAMVQAMLTDAEATGDAARVARIRQTMENGGNPGQVLINEFGSTERATQMLMSAIVHAGVTIRVGEEAVRYGEFSSAASETAFRFRIRNKFLSQMKKWNHEDPSDAMQFIRNRYGDDSPEALQYASMLDDPDIINNQYYGDIQNYMVRSNQNRNTELALYLDMVAKDPSILTRFLEDNPTYFQPVAWEKLNDSSDMAGDWVRNLKGEDIAGLSKQVGIEEVLAARDANQTMPSVLKVLDPVTGNQPLREKVGMSGVVDDIKGWLTGKRPYGLTTPYNLNANPLTQMDIIDSPVSGKFTPARLDTVTKQDAVLFFDTLDILIERRAAVQSLVDASDASGIDIGAEIINNLQRNGRKVNLSSLDDAEYAAFIDTLTARNPQTTKKVQSVIGGRVKTRTVKVKGGTTRLNQLSSAQVRRLKSAETRRLLQHMEAAKDLRLDPRTILSQLDDTMDRMSMNTDIWSDTFNLGHETMKRPAGRSVSDHLKRLGKEGRQRAEWFASEVDAASYDPALADQLGRNGHKLVYGQEFWEPLTIVDNLQMPVSLVEDVGTSVMRTLPFIPDAIAETALAQKMAKPVTRMAAWAMYPGEKMFIPVFTRRLQQETSRALMASFDRNPAQFAKFGITDKADLAPMSPIVKTIIDSQQSRLSEVQRTSQNLQDSTLGMVSRTASRIQHSVVPRTLVDPAVRNLSSDALVFRDARFTAGGKFLPFTKVFDEKTLKGLSMALRNAQDISDSGRNMSQAMKVRGPTLIARDWIETQGMAKGALSGAGLFLFGGTTARASIEQQSRIGGYLSYAKGATGRGIIGAGAAAGYGAIQSYQETGNPFAEVDMQTIGLAGAGAAAGGMAGFVGGAMGAQAGLPEAALGIAGGAAISRRGFGLPSRIGRMTGKLDETQDFSSVATGLSSQAGGITAGLLGVEGDTEQTSVVQRMGAVAAGAALGPTLGRVIGDAAVGMKVWNSTMTERTLNLSMALRFTLSPLFDMQRHIELATMAITKSPEGYAVPVVPLGARAFRKKHGAEAWSAAERRFDDASTAVHGSQRAKFASADETARAFRDEGILGFNPTDKSVSIMDSLVGQGMDPLEAYKASRSVTTYGVEGRKTGELFANSLFFPLSFQARYIGRGIKWMADDAARAMYISDALVTYQLLEETYNLDDKLRDYLPLAKSLQKLNGLAMGVSLGEFGGIDRPFINLFIPVMAQAYRTAEGTLALTSPSDALGQAQELEPLNLKSTINRLVPMYRDIQFLVDDAKDQWRVIASEHHMTSDNQRKAAMQRWSAEQANADVVAQANGFKDYTSFVRSGRPGADRLGRKMSRTQVKLEREYPLWGEGRDEGVVRWTANERVLKRRGADPKIPVDAEIARMMFFIDQLKKENPTSESFIDWADADSIPVTYQNEIRDYAMQLAQQGHGFEQIWDKYFRNTYGPIRRPVYQSAPAQDRSILKQGSRR